MQNLAECTFTHQFLFSILVMAVGIEPGISGLHVTSVVDKYQWNCSPFSPCQLSFHPLRCGAWQSWYTVDLYIGFLMVLY